MQQMNDETIRASISFGAFAFNGPQSKIRLNFDSLEMD